MVHDGHGALNEAFESDPSAFNEAFDEALDGGERHLLAKQQRPPRAIDGKRKWLLKTQYEYLQVHLTRVFVSSMH
jgi:hypothetical protein